MWTLSWRLICQERTQTQKRCERRKCQNFSDILRICPSVYNIINFVWPTKMCLQNIRMSENKCWELGRLYLALPKMHYVNFYSFKFSKLSIFKDGERIDFRLLVRCNICWKTDSQGRFKFDGQLGDRSWHFLISSFGSLWRIMSTQQEFETWPNWKEESRSIKIHAVACMAWRRICAKPKMALG
jgi:hypothetical protein